MNLQDELVRADQRRQRKFSGQVSLDELKDILTKECETEKSALQRLGISQHKITVVQRSWVKQCQLNQEYQGGIYHEDDVRKICMDYQMRMLPSNLYRGPVDPLFGSKVKKFEQQHPLTAEETEGNYFIVAPAETFALEERQRPIENIDPLLLYKVDDHFYKLVHQWGADLHVFRYVNAWRHRSLLHMTFHWMLITFMLAMLLLGFFLNDLGSAVLVASLISGLIGWMHFSSLHDRPEELRHLYSKHNWNQTWTY